MNLVVQALLSNVAIVAVLAVAVHALTRFWRNPQFAHALWVLVLLKLVTPPLVSVPFPAWFLTENSRPAAPGSARDLSAAPLGSGHIPRDEPPSTAISTNTSNSIGGWGTFVVVPALEAPHGIRQWNWCDWLLGVWGAGSFFVAGVGINRVRRFARLVAATSLADDAIQCEATELARNLGMRSSPLVRIVHGAIPPVVWSVGLKTEILLPAALLGHLGREERRTILVHELAHVRRLDHWVRWLEALVVVLYWWNPVVWLVRRELNHVEERCCDAWVVWLAPESRRTYAGAILQTIEFLGAAQARLPVGASGMARNFPLKIRMAAILADSQAHRLSWPLRLAVVAAGLVALPLSAGPSSPVDSPLWPRRLPVARPNATSGSDADSRAQRVPATSAVEIASFEGDNISGAAAAPAPAQGRDDAAPVLRGRLFARGFWWRSDRIGGKMAIASIDPATGDWKPLVENSDSFSVTPDGETIFFSKDGALWNGDARKNENPGKVFAEAGRVVFAPDGKSMLVTTWKRKADKPEEYETIVWKMGIDGTSAVPIVDLAAWGSICDWSSDGQWLLAEKDLSIRLVRPDGKESRPLLKRAHFAEFSRDGKRVVYTNPGITAGRIRVIDTDGSNDRAVVELPQLTYANPASWGPDGKHLASVLMDLKFGNDGATPVLFSDPDVSRPRIAVFDAATGEQRTVTLPRQDDWDFFPTGEIEWR
jgi:beta-lactamase regulating signal transducer with metallopeptidase domain